MLKRIVIAGVIGLVSIYSTIAAAQTKWPQYPEINYGGRSATQIMQIKRGEYLAKVGDCIACHTNPKQNDKPFAGNRAFLTPFGTIYTPNITGDKKFGVGRWSNKQFIKAMHEGISPASKYYYPAFPYSYFNRVTDTDLIAIKTYLDAVPAIAEAPRKNSMRFPFNWRFLQLGWRSLFFYFQKNNAYQPDPSKTTQWNRGAYLVQGLGHCSMCHTPTWHMISNKYPLVAPKRKHFLAGGYASGMFAPDITAHTLKDVTDDRIVAVFKEAHRINGGNIVGPMLEVNQDSLRYLTDADLTAIATYLKTVHSAVTVPSKSLSQPKKAVAVDDTASAKLYTTHCAMCHAMGGGNIPKFGNKTDWEKILAKRSLQDLYDAAIHGYNAMPARGGCSKEKCSDEQLRQTVDYMLKDAGVSVKK